MPSPAPLPGFDFFETNEKGATAAEMSFIRGIKTQQGNFRPQNLLKRDAAYRRGKGHSEVFSFRWIPATAYTRDNKTVDVAKLEYDYINNGRKPEDLAKYLALITQVRTQRYSMQMYPKTAIIESEAVSRTDATLVGSGDAEAGLIMTLGSRDFTEAALASETLENNNTFIAALRKTSIVFKKRRWDGGVSEEDQDVLVDLPAYTRYTCPKAFLTPDDLGRIRVQMQNNLTDTPALRRPMKLLVSPAQFESFIRENEKVQSSDFALHGGVLETGTLPTYRGFTFESHSMVRDDEAFAYVPGLTVAASDWGVFTKVKEDANIWTSSSARRQYQYDCKVVEPLTLIQISFTGAEANAPIGTVGSKTGDAIFDQVRDPKGVLTPANTETTNILGD